MNNVKKQSFRINSIMLDCNRSIPVELGYETYGTLNANKDNAILIPHYFSGSSHVAGKYHDDDAIPGYWDGLVGPNKAIDTNKYFVISIDNLCNVEPNNPNVITTGPRSINPATNEIWGLDFPPFTFRDIARIQNKFITEQLGIKQLHAIIGASAGGFIGMYWAIDYPEAVKKYVGVITNPQNPILTSFTVLQHAMRTIALDPKWNNGNYSDEQPPLEGLGIAIQMMNTGAFTADYFETNFKRDSQDVAPYYAIDHPASYEVALQAQINKSLSNIDASHWYYTAHATMLHDVAYLEGSLENALSKIQADVLMISCTQDMLQPTKYNEEMIEILHKHNKNAKLVKIDSNKGHMAGILDTHLFSDDIKNFIAE